MIENDESALAFSYDFSPQETAILARFIRWYGLPDGLERFSSAVLETIYNSMTIADIEKFFQK